MITLSLWEALAYAGVMAVLGIGVGRLLEGLILGARSLREVDEQPAVAEPTPPAGPVAIPAAHEGPWSFQHLFDDLREPTAPDLPKHPWLTDPSGSLPLVELPEAPTPRELVVSTKLDDLVLTDRVQVTQ